MSQSKTKGFVLIAAVYLLGLFIGALDTGIVTPARTVIQDDLQVGEQLGIWMITIYTLAYAAAIPVMGKLADKYGRKYIYLTSIFLFGLGSLFCGLAQDFGSFELLIAARAVQAIGGGGIMPVATAEFGTSFPEDKRGMALGLTGGVYGIANIFGASVGSFILDTFGQHNWQYIFYINLPICLFILVVGFFVLPNTKERDVRPIDILGIGVLVVMILSLLYGLRGIDFYNFGTSITSLDVYPFLIGFVVLLPVFVLVEHRAADPVLNLAYFKNPSIVITLVLAVITGVVMMGMIFIPQFAANAMRMPSGSGGYFVIILALFAGLGAPVSGKLIDKFGVKIVLAGGFVASVVGALFLAFVATSMPNMVTVIVSLVLLGTGMGFTMGTPLNYMMLAKTKESESNSALATLSLVRSIGTAVAPAIMVAFLAQAGVVMQGNLMNELPKQVSVPPLPYEQQVTDELNQLKSDSAFKDKIDALNIPDFSSMNSITIDPSGKSGNGDSAFKPTPEQMRDIQNSDVTTIVANTKALASAMFESMAPTITKNINDGIDKGIDGANSAIEQMKSSLQSMPPAQAAQMQGALTGLETLVDQLQKMKDGVPQALDGAKQNYLNAIDAKAGAIEDMYQTTLSDGFRNMFILVAACSAVGLILTVFYHDDKRGAKLAKSQKRQTSSSTN